ncbi:MAG: SUF system NifU family Fe-S cluster assembly protein [Planctomycetes bacterium]|nr:SUF system NifU family Fe-S cluster assembly protein [Planctomycetota bacterium]
MLDDLYRELILDHYRSPRGAAPLERTDRRAEGQNPLCGDECTVSLRLDGEKVLQVGFRGRGCSISVASGSMMAGEIEGLSLAEVRRLEASVKSMLQGKGRDPSLDLGDLEALEGVARFPVRVKCALLPWTTLLEALSRKDPAGERARVTTEQAGPGPGGAAGGGGGGI